MYVSEWENRGIIYWKVANNNITLVADQAVYTMFRSTADGTFKYNSRTWC